MRMRRLALLAASAAMLAPVGCATTLPGEASHRADPTGPDPPLLHRPGHAGFPLPAERGPGRRRRGDGRPATSPSPDATRTARPRRSRGAPPIGRSITVTLRSQKPITRVSCRVGWFGRRADVAHADAARRRPTGDDATRGDPGQGPQRSRPEPLFLPQMPSPTPR